MLRSLRTIFIQRHLAWVWLAVRLYLAWEWLSAGWEKLHGAAWTGSMAGTAVKAFLQAALTKTGGSHPDVQSWYAWLISHVGLSFSVTLSFLVTYGELTIGLLILLGLWTRKGALLGAFMNTNYLLAGTLSVNPQMLILEILLMAAGPAAGRIGLDGFFGKKFSGK